MRCYVSLRARLGGSEARGASQAGPAVRLDSNDQEEVTMSAKNKTLRRQLSRREVLKGAAATAGMLAASGAIGGFPTIWAQNIKDVKLVQVRSEEHTSELQSHSDLVCRLLLEKK